MFLDARAIVNGIGESISSVSRILGPTVLCNLFAWSCDKNHVWPLNYLLTFYVQALIGIGGVIWIHFLLPSDFESRMKAKKSDEKH